MHLNEVNFSEATPIDGYGPGFFRVGGNAFQGAVLITASGASGWGGLADRQPLLDLVGHIDVVFIGTGAETAHISDDLRSELEAAEIGVEVMNSPAACRTYNVLLSEGRRVAAALLPV